MRDRDNNNTPGQCSAASNNTLLTHASLTKKNTAEVEFYIRATSPHRAGPDRCLSGAAKGTLRVSAGATAPSAEASCVQEWPPAVAPAQDCGRSRTRLLPCQTSGRAVLRRKGPPSGPAVLPSFVLVRWKGARVLVTCYHSATQAWARRTRMYRRWRAARKNTSGPVQN